MATLNTRIKKSGIMLNRIIDISSPYKGSGNNVSAHVKLVLFKSSSKFLCVLNDVANGMFTTTAIRTSPEANKMPRRLLTIFECLCGKKVAKKRSTVNITMSQGEVRLGIDVATNIHPQLPCLAACAEKSSFLMLPTASDVRLIIKFNESLTAENIKYTAKACGANLSRRIRKKRHVFPTTPKNTIKNSTTRIDFSASSTLWISEL